MNRCPKCGTEFEGKFCPNCGTKWEEEKICPSCGAKLNGATRFCNECGYSFIAENEVRVENDKKQELGQKNTLATIYGILKYIPTFLFALFAVLLFIFYIAPVAVLPAQEFMGEKTPSESYGNVYSMYSGILSEIPKLKGAMLTLILLAVFALILAIVTILVIYHPTTQNKEIKLFDKVQIKIGVLLNFISFIVYLIFFIIGCVVCGKISAMDEGMEIFAPGACPILLIVFSLVFTLLGTGAFVARFMLRKKNPELAQIEVDKAQAQAEAERQRKEQYYATHSAPVAPTITKDGKLNKKQACVFKHEKKRYKKAKEGKPSNAVIWFDLHKGVLSMCVLGLAVIIAAICILIPIFTNNFKISKVEKIELGFTQEQVRDVLGDPYEETMTDYCWQYFDDDYSKVLDKLAANSKEQEKVLTNGNESKLLKLLEEEEKLETQLASMTYKYIEINFSQVINEENNYAVSSVYFEPNKCDSNSTTSKKVENVKLSTENSVGYYVDSTGAEEKKILIDYEGKGELYYSAYYSDGAFYRGYLADNITDINGENDTLEWSDKFASYEMVNNVIEIGTVSVNGVWKTTYKDVKALILPESVTSIGESAFSGCNSLVSITIPESVTSIGDYAFYQCDNLTNVYYEGTLEDWCNGSITCHSIFSSENSNHFHLRNRNNEWEEVTNIEIPNTITKIGAYQFSGFSNVTSITIPESVTSIGEGAFYECSSLTSITIPNSVTSIGDNAFYCCSSLTSITIPDSVTSIGDRVFANCSSLTSIVIPNSVTSIGFNAFLNCYRLVEIYNLSSIDITVGSEDNGYVGYYTKVIHTSLEEESNLILKDDYVFIKNNENKYYLVGYNGLETDLVLPNDIEGNTYEINQCAFYKNSSLESVLLPDTVTYIGERAFYECGNLTSITIPESVTSIGDYAFYQCDNLTNVYYEGTIEDWCNINFNSSVFYYANSNHFYLKNSKNKWKEISSIEIPNTITEIGDYQFYGFNNVTSITIPTSVTSIKYEAFSRCHSLTNITIPNSVTSIGEGAFFDCYSLTSVVIPNSVTSIEDSAFEGCDNLQYHEYDNGYYLGNEENPYLVLIMVESTDKSTCEIHSNTKIIHSSAFYRCNLASITIPNSVTSIGFRAFDSCSSLTSIVIPNSVTSIGDSAFEGCSSLTSVTISNSVTSIGFRAFYRCSSLTSIIIPNSVTSIEDSAFEGCSSLTSIVIPNSVASIGGSAFEGCSSLTDVYYEGTIEEWCELNYAIFSSSSNANHFYIRNSNNEWEELKHLEIPENVTTIGESQFYNFNNVTFITMGNSVTSIGDDAFSDCSSLTSIVIPNSVTSIGFRAFYSCSSLTSVYYLGTSTEWNNIDKAYYGNSYLTSATIYYYSETKPTSSGNYWHYVDGVVTKW